MELRRIYNDDYRFLGYMKDRGEPLDEGENIVVAGVMVISEGKLLITKRAAGKTFAHQWEFTMGSVVGEESALEGALRELSEEVGIKASAGELQKLGTLKERQKFSEIYRLNRSITSVTMQASEVEDYRLVDRRELLAMLDRGDFAAPMERRIRHYFKAIEGDLA